MLLFLEEDSLDERWAGELRSMKRHYVFHRDCVQVLMDTTSGFLRVIGVDDRSR